MEVAGDLSRMPEECIAHILSFTSPRDACRSAAVSSFFRSFADSDAVWTRLLPDDAHDIASRSASSLRFSSMKELYFLLCKSTLLDQGKLRFWLEKLTGKKCFMISGTELSAIGANGRQLKLIKFRFGEMATIHGIDYSKTMKIAAKFSTRMLSPNTTYAVYLVCTMDPDKYKWYIDDELSMPTPRSGVWMEVAMGELFHEGGEGEEVEVSIRREEGMGPDPRFIIRGVEIRPSPSA